MEVNGVHRASLHKDKCSDKYKDNCKDKSKDKDKDKDDCPHHDVAGSGCPLINLDSLSWALSPLMLC